MLPAQAQMRYYWRVTESLPGKPAVDDKWVGRFLTHLATDRGASVHTQRNYRQALEEFSAWHRQEQRGAAVWDRLQRDDFRAYLRFLGRKNLARSPILLPSRASMRLT